MTGRPFGALGADFEDFVRDAATPLLRTAVLLVGDRGHAEDLVQLAFIRTAGRWSRAKQAPTAYARRVLVNLAKDTWRNRSRRPEAPAWGDALPERAVPAGGDGVLDRDELLGALAQLPWQQRAVLVLRFFEDLPADQVAEILRCPPGTVRSQTHRGLARMRAVLQPINPPHGSKDAHV